ncbi:hypothetical protein Nmel_005730 [Mimus melanotis]
MTIWYLLLHRREMH